METKINLATCTTIRLPRVFSCQDIDAAQNWCRSQFGMDSVPRGIWDQWSDQFFFKNEEDAVLFALRWA